MTRAQRIEALSRQGPIRNWERIVELEDALKAIAENGGYGEEQWDGVGCSYAAEAALARGASE